MLPQDDDEHLVIVSFSSTSKTHHCLIFLVDGCLHRDDNELNFFFLIVATST
jgi:hypothetical protein